MPFASTTTPIGAPLDPKLLRNTHLILMGVSRYDDPSTRPVPSAYANVKAWLLQALRMGLDAEYCPMYTDGAVGDKDAFLADLQDTLTQADLGATESQVTQQIQDLAKADAKNWDTRDKGTSFKELLTALVFEGNNLECYPEHRLLLVYSGHGAVSQERLVLCPSDTCKVSAPPAGPTSPDRRKALCADLRKRGASSRNAADFETAAKLIEEAGPRAAKLGVESELLDVLALPVEKMGTVYSPGVIVKMIRAICRNLAILENPSQATLPATPPTYGRVITPVHFVLALGHHASRVTLVLDACHAGGPGNALQGSMAGHTWTQTGLRCHIFSASQAAQLAAEARIGDRRYSAATWAMTQVLSRWNRVEDGNAYALGIRCGDLVQRTNQLLNALSFQQQVAFHAPSPRPGERSPADLPFFGLYAGTRTTVDPDGESDGIQLASDTNQLTGWRVETVSGGVTTLRALLLAVGSAADWTYPQTAPNRTYARSTLYIFGTGADVSTLSSGAFQLRMFQWSGTGSIPTEITGAIDQFVGPMIGVSADNDKVSSTNPDGEHQCTFPSQGTQLPGVYKYQNGTQSAVYLRWVAPTIVGNVPQDKGKLYFLTRTSFPFTPANFVGQTAMAFNSAGNETFNNTCWERTITFPLS